MLTVISHSACHGHEPGGAHPEHADRLDAINDQLIMSGLQAVLDFREAPRVTMAQLQRVHGAAYIERILATPVHDGPQEVDPDTIWASGSDEAALRAAGAGVLAVDLAMADPRHRSFCAIRPPGHHAGRDQAMGFCFFNNIAVAAAHALAFHGLTRVAIVDFDVHHGNGTEAIFRDDPRVLFCSSFQHPFYPFTGHDSDAPNLVGVPLPAGTGSAAFREAISAHWLPALERFAPQMLFISAGFDAHRLDEMSNMGLVEADFEWITEALVKVAGRHADGRIVSMLEGGYDPGALARSVVSHLRALMDY
ncbi:MAG: histone deacetylase family protein [Burkholderiaceae bacterium]